MELPFAEPRMPLRSLLAEDLGLTEEHIESFSSKFDMGRMLQVNLYSIALNFAMIEHTLRSTTPSQEQNNIIEQLSKPLASKINQILYNRLEECNPFSLVETLVRESDLRTFPHIKAIVKLYSIKRLQITHERIYSYDTRNLPIIYMLSIDNKFVVLYTPTMTFVDRYDPLTGHHLSGELPNLLVKKARISLYKSCTKPTNQEKTEEEESPYPNEMESFGLSPILPRELTEQEKFRVKNLHNRNCCASCLIF